MNENALNCLCPSLEMISGAEPCLRIILHWILGNLIVYLTYNRSTLQYPILRIDLYDLWTEVFTIQVNYFAIWATFEEYFIAILPREYIVKRLVGGFFLNLHIEHYLLLTWVTQWPWCMAEWVTKAGIHCSHFTPFGNWMAVRSLSSLVVDESLSSSWIVCLQYSGPLQRHAGTSTSLIQGMQIHCYVYA